MRKSGWWLMWILYFVSYAWSCRKPANFGYGFVVVDHAPVKQVMDLLDLERVAYLTAQRDPRAALPNNATFSIINFREL